MRYFLVKRINILSYTNTTNYGGLLQLYALSKVLSRDFDVNVIRYNNTSRIQRSKFRDILAHLYNSVFRFLSIDKKRKNNEKRFLNYVPLTQSIYSASNSISKISCDYFLVGSDQVWNPYLNGFDATYLFNFDTQATKVSYAASFGVEKIPDEWSKKVGDCLTDFKHISLREKTGMDILNSISSLKNIKKTIDLDPTLLIEKKEWEECFCAEPLFNKKYILIYLMPGDKKIEKEMIQIGKKKAKNERCKLVVIGRKNIDKYNIFKSGYYHAGPAEFVNLVYYADFVITNSFHGTAFSVNLNKPFLSFVNSKQNSANSLKSRILDFLNQLGLDDNIFDVSKDHNLLKNFDIDYSVTNKKLELLRDSSLQNLYGNFKN